VWPGAVGEGYGGNKMKCPKCQYEVPDGMKFCGECGSKLEVLCPSCGFINPPQFKFCGECGTQLSEKINEYNL